MDQKYFNKIVSASIMGDGFFFKVDQDNDKQNTHFMLKQSIGHEDYIERIANIVEQLTRVQITENKPYICNRGYNIDGQIILKTMRHPQYKKMYNRLYRPVGNTHVKVLDSHYLTLFDLESLAMMYMDDGWIESKECVTKEDYLRIGIASHKYTYFENLHLRNLIAERFNLHFEVTKHKQKSGEYKYYLRSSGRNNCLRFLDAVKPFIVPSYEYKLNV